MTSKSQKCENIEEENSLIVDSLLHINETLYDSITIHDLFKKSGLFGYVSVDPSTL